MALSPNVRPPINSAYSRWLIQAKAESEAHDHATPSYPVAFCEKLEGPIHLIKGFPFQSGMIRLGDARCALDHFTRRGFISAALASQVPDTPTSQIPVSENPMDLVPEKSVTNHLKLAGYGQGGPIEKVVSFIAICVIYMIVPELLVLSILFWLIMKGMQSCSEK